MKNFTDAIMDLASQADESGNNVLGVALLNVAAIGDLPPQLARRLVNQESMLLETLRFAAAGGKSEFHLYE